MHSKRINSISPFSNVIINIGFILFSTLCIIPIILILSASFTSEAALAKYGYSLIPKEFTTYAYMYLFKDGITIVRAYGVTITVTIVGTALATLIIALYAYPLFRKDFRYRKQFTVFLAITMLFSGGLVPYYIVLSQLCHLKDNLWALIIPGCFNAFWVIVMRTFYTTNIPESLIESAKIDGAGEVRTYFKIVLPLSVPGLATVALFTSLSYWNDFYTPMLLLREKIDTYQNLQYMIYRALMNTQMLNMIQQKMAGTTFAVEVPSETFRMAMAIVTIGPIIFAYPFFQKYFIKGLTIGAIKG